MADLSNGRPAGDWEPGRWWRVVAPDDSVWCETSDEQEACEALRPGDTLFRLWGRSEQEWRRCPDVSALQSKGDGDG